MSAHQALAGRLAIPGAIVLSVLLQSACALQALAQQTTAQQPTAAQQPSAAAQKAPPAQQAPRAAVPTRPQPAAAQDPNAQPPRAAAPQPRVPSGPTQQPSTAPIAGAPARPIPRTPPTPGVRPVQHMQPALPPLSPEQEAELDRVLTAWETESDKIKTLSANFTVWEYGDPFGKSTGGPPKLKREAKGEIHFAAPDKGSFRELEGGDQRWMCDGSAIYEFKAKEKELHEYRLPDELKGKAISKGPLPFVFGAKADMMKQRYAMRIVTPADAKEQIWIEAWPRTQQDAANFNHVQVILDTKMMLPVAIRMYDIDHSHEAPKFKVYAFANTKVNGTWEQIKNFFVRPMTPPLWKRVVENVPSSPPAGGPTPANSVKMQPGAIPARPGGAAGVADKRSQPASTPPRPR